MAGPRNILVVAAHPDDELLGCGGTLARHAREGDRVHILILATGATSRHGGGDAEVTALREAAAAAAAVIGAIAPRFGEFPDNRMDGIDLLDVVNCIEAVGGEVMPDVVYTHSAGDLNVDHRIAHEAVMTAFRPLPGARCPAIYGYETLSSSEWASSEAQPAFRPVRFVDISETLETKLAALSKYAAEMRDFPHPRSKEGVEALARVRGASAGIPAAEAFVVLRQVI